MLTLSGKEPSARIFMGLQPNRHFLHNGKKHHTGHCNKPSTRMPAGIERDMWVGSSSTNHWHPAAKARKKNPPQIRRPNPSQGDRANHCPRDRKAQAMHHGTNHFPDPLFPVDKTRSWSALFQPCHSSVLATPRLPGNLWFRCLMQPLNHRMHQCRESHWHPLLVRSQCSHR